MRDHLGELERALAPAAPHAQPTLEDIFAAH
jgi:hypothetical protein